MIVALAASAALSFAPPLGRPVRYETTERRARPDGTMRSATLVLEVDFATDPDGYVMTIRTTGYNAPPSPDRSMAFDAVMKPMVGTIVRIHLSRGGVPERVIDGATSWSAMLSALRAQIGQYPPGDPGMAPAAAVLATLGAAPPAARDACLIAAADDLLGMRLPPLAIGEQAREEGGTVARTPGSAEEARYVEQHMHAAAGRSLETDVTVTVSQTTGLIVHSLRKIAVAGTWMPLVLSESETRLTSR